MTFDDDVRKTVADRLEAMEGPVTLPFFTQEHECAFCRETRDGPFLEAVLAALHDRRS